MSSIPSHPLSIDLNAVSLKCDIKGIPVWYKKLETEIAKSIDKNVELHEICFSLSWRTPVHGEEVPIDTIVGEFSRTVEYLTGMIAKYKHCRTINVTHKDYAPVVIVTFVATSCY